MTYNPRPWKHFYGGPPKWGFLMANNNELLPQGEYSDALFDIWIPPDGKKYYLQFEFYLDADTEDELQLIINGSINTTFKGHCSFKNTGLIYLPSGNVRIVWRFKKVTANQVYSGELSNAESYPYSRCFLNVVKIIQEYETGESTLIPPSEGLFGDSFNTTDLNSLNESEQQQIKNALSSLGYEVSNTTEWTIKDTNAWKQFEKDIGNVVDGLVSEYDMRCLNLWKEHIATGEKVSLYYNDTDFECHDDSNKVRMHPIMLKTLDNLTRIVAGMSIEDYEETPSKLTITSGYRTPEYNATLSNAATNSLHLKGMAVDIAVPEGETVDSLAEKCKQAGFTGIGRYYNNNFVHADIGPVREWTG